MDFAGRFLPSIKLSIGGTHTNVNQEIDSQGATSSLKSACDYEAIFVYRVHDMGNILHALPAVAAFDPGPEQENLAISTTRTV